MYCTAKRRYAFCPRNAARSSDRRWPRNGIQPRKTLCETTSKSAIPNDGSVESETLRSATELPSGARSGPSRENQNDSVRSVASAGMATGCTITNWEASPPSQLPSEVPPIRAAYRPVRTIAAVVPASWRSARLTPPHPLQGAPSSKPPFCSSSWANASRGANEHREAQRSRPRRPNTTSGTEGTRRRGQR